MNKPDNPLIEAVCREVLAVSSALGLPDDDLLHCLASTTVLKARDINAFTTVHRFVDATSIGLGRLEFAVLEIDGVPHDTSGQVGDWHELHQRRLSYLASRYGLDLFDDHRHCTTLEADLNAAIATRWPSFADQCSQVAHIARTRLDDPKTPLPSRQHDLPMHGGPLVRERYERCVHLLQSARDCSGLSELLTEWEIDPDSARPANFPQQLLELASNLRVGERNPTKQDEVVAFVDRLRHAGASLFEPLRSNDNLILNAILARNEKLARYFVLHGLPLARHPTAGALSALSLAIDFGLIELASFLLDNGAPPAFKQLNVLTDPLTLAVRGGYADLVEQLISLGAHPHHDRSPDTNLLLYLIPPRCAKGATSTGHLSIARMLLEHGVSPHEENVNGLSPMAAAQSRGAVELTQLFSIWLAERLDQATQRSHAIHPLRRL